jgi:hypothetical protein
MSLPPRVLRVSLLLILFAIFTVAPLLLSSGHAQPYSDIPVQPAIGTSGPPPHHASGHHHLPRRHWHRSYRSIAFSPLLDFQSAAERLRRLGSLLVADGGMASSQGPDTLSDINRLGDDEENAEPTRDSPLEVAVARVENCSSSLPV